MKLVSIKSCFFAMTYVLVFVIPIPSPSIFQKKSHTKKIAEIAFHLIKPISIKYCFSFTIFQQKSYLQIIVDPNLFRRFAAPFARGTTTSCRRISGSAEKWRNSGNKNKSRTTKSTRTTSGIWFLKQSKECWLIELI